MWQCRFVEEINGKGPRNLRNALKVMGGEIHQMRKKLRRYVRSGFQKTPRQVCKVCAKLFDYAVIDPNTKAAASLCSDCLALLKDGYTAIVSMNPDVFAFVKSDYLKEHGQAGQIVQLSAENFAKIKQRFDDDKKANGSGPEGDSKT